MRERRQRRTGDRGAALVEYAVLLGLVAVVCVGGLALLGGRADAKLRGGGSGLSGSTTSSTSTTVDRAEAQKAEDEQRAAEEKKASEDEAKAVEAEKVAAEQQLAEAERP